MTLPTNIDEVLFQLDRIVVQSKVDASRLGYFALLYREVTAAVKKGIAEGYFADAARMEQLDVVFANRYIEAYEQYQAGQTPSRSWEIAFEAAEQSDLLILQHLLLGMNAHINLDLGIAAATIAPDEQSIKDLHADFFRINDILFDLINTMQDRLARLSLALRWLDKIGGDKDEKLAGFSLSKARDHAWNLANLLAPLPMEHWPPAVETADKAAALLAQVIRQPKGRVSRWTIGLIHQLESKDVVENMKHLLG